MDDDFLEWIERIGRQEVLAGDVQVVVVPISELPVARGIGELAPPAPCLSGLIRIDYPDGVRVSVDAHVDAGALARVLR